MRDGLLSSIWAGIWVRSRFPVGAVLDRGRGRRFWARLRRPMGTAAVEIGFWEGAAGPSAAQGVEDVCVDVFPGISRAELEPHAAHAQPDDGPDLEQLEAEGIDLGLGPLGTLQA